MFSLTFLHTKRDFCLEKSSIEKLKSRKAIKKGSFIESELLETIMFSEGDTSGDTSIERNKKFNSSCKINIQKGNAIVM